MDTIINSTDYPEQYVYHYTNATTAIEKILGTGTLLFNTYDKVNDPRESKDWEFDIRADFSLGDSLEPDRIISKLTSQILKSTVKMVCFCLDSPASLKFTTDGILSRGYSKPVMWHHYANKHDGICLMFDRKELDAAFRRNVVNGHLVSKAVEYSNSGFLSRLSGHPFLLDLSGIKNVSTREIMYATKRHFESYFDQLFFKKLENWSNEAEFRWVYFDDTTSPIPIKFDNALVGILIGDNVSSHTVKAIHDYSSKNKICYQQITWRNGFPKYQSPHLLDT